MSLNGLPAPTVLELQWWDVLRDYGCWVCRHHLGIIDHSVPEIHHLLNPNKVSHKCVIPLCTPHHRHNVKGHESRHSVTGKSGEAAFTAAYRSDWDMFEYMLWNLGYIETTEQAAPPFKFGNGFIGRVKPDPIYILEEISE